MTPCSLALTTQETWTWCIMTNTTEACMPPITPISHDDLMTWKHLLRYWPFVRGIHQSPRSEWVIKFNKQPFPDSRQWGPYNSCNITVMSPWQLCSIPHEIWWSFLVVLCFGCINSSSQTPMIYLPITVSTATLSMGNQVIVSAPVKNLWNRRECI